MNPAMSVIDDLNTQDNAILSALPIPILLVNKENIIVKANDSCEDFFERSKNRIEDRSVEQIIKFNDKRINDALVTMDNDLSAQNMEIITPSGSALVDVWINALQSHQDMRIIMIVKRREKRDYIGDHSEAGDQMAMGAPAILSHEIKNPLAGIKGAAQFLAKKADATELAMTNLIVTEVDRIARLLDQMQNLGNHNPVQFREENIHIILDQALQSIRIANPKFPDIITQYDPSLPNIYVDYDAVLQILINLIQNGIDACRDVENPEILIKTHYVMSGSLRRSNDQNTNTVKLPIEVVIKDNGPGVPDHIQNELFTPFVTTKREGQGLGLAIVRKFIRQLNSRILHERDEQNGQTIFRILLPMSHGIEK